MLAALHKICSIQSPRSLVFRMPGAADLHRLDSSFDSCLEFFCMESAKQQCLFLCLRSSLL